jgi:hypothetical protein
MKNLLIGVLIGAIIILGAWLLFYSKAQAPAEEVLNGNNIVSTTSPNTTTPVIPSQSGAGMIRIDMPAPNQFVASPLRVAGEAKGGWYFEASAPVKILDANGKTLGEGFVTAQGEWMTENFVPFEGTLRFTPPTTSTGTLVFSNDNPSGLPENQKTFSIPVKFVQ